MSTPRRASALAAFLMLIAVFTPLASAQPSLAPGVTVTCDHSEIPKIWNIETDGSLSINCEIENPTVYAEEISLEYEVNGILATGAETVSLDMQESTTIVVTISQGSASNDPLLHNVTVTATVTSVRSIR